jgi:hypothetical protein
LAEPILVGGKGAGRGQSVIKRLLRFGKQPLDVPAKTTQDLAEPQKQKELINRLITKGTIFSRDSLSKLLADALATSYYRRTFYRDCEQAASHPLVAGALDLYVDSVCSVSGLTNRSVWCTSEDPKIENTVNQFLEEIALEEKIRDWAGQLGLFGDFFVEGIGREGIGIAFADDNFHPADIERIDINGRLEGFIRTGQFTQQAQYTADMEAPWKYSHFKVAGVTRKVLNTALGIFGEPGRMFSLEQSKLQDRKFRVTTRYGVSLLTNAIPIYKRLKMCEDSLLMSRMTRGILWYLYKIKVSGGNMDSAAELVQGYAEYLKRSLASGLDTDTNQQMWKDKWAPVFGQVEDMFVPESDDVSVSVEKLGGEPDIKAIVDVDMLINQLLGSLRVSKSMLGITDDLPGAIGEGAANRISINFAKNAQRLQAGLRQGVKRFAQIHLAFRNLNPDPTRFEINFTEISSAEEEEIKNALDKGVDIVDKAMDMIVKNAGEGQIDKLELLDYFNRKVLKLNDLDLAAMRINVLEAKAAAGDDGLKDTIKKLVEAAKAKYKLTKPRVKQITTESDLFAYLPEVDKDKTKLDENVQKLVDAPDDTLDEAQAQMKREVLAVKPAKLFRVDDTMAVKEERAKWRPIRINVDMTKKDGNGQ